MVGPFCGLWGFKYFERLHATGKKVSEKFEDINDATRSILFECLSIYVFNLMVVF
jgi:hypothetical protein